MSWVWWKHKDKCWEHVRWVFQINVLVSAEKVFIALFFPVISLRSGVRNFFIFFSERFLPAFVCSFFLFISKQTQNYSGTNYLTDRNWPADIFLTFCFTDITWKHFDFSTDPISFFLAVFGATLVALGLAASLRRDVDGILIFSWVLPPFSSVP